MITMSKRTLPIPWVLWVLLVMQAIAAEPEKPAPDYKALYERANASAAAWKARAEELDALLAFQKEKTANAENRLRERIEIAKTDLQPKPLQSVILPAPSAPAPHNQPWQPKPKVVRVNVALNRWYHLVTLGGPNKHLAIVQAEMTFITVKYSRGANPKRLNIDGNGRAFIDFDGLGCSTYYVHDPMRPAGTAVLEFQHSENSLYHPDRHTLGTRYQVLPGT